jgi:hypothetical protein
MAAREPLLSNIRRAIAREAVIFMLIAAAIGSIGYATVNYRTYRSTTIDLRVPELLNGYVVACADTEVAVGSNAIGNHDTEEFCVPSNFPNLSQEKQIHVMRRDADFEQLPYAEQKKVVAILSQRVVELAAQRLDKTLGTSRTTGRPQLILFGALTGFVGGFPAGLVIWLLYRLVRFAVEG